MKAWLIAIASIVLGAVVALTCVWGEFRGLTDQFAPNNLSARSLAEAAAGGQVAAPKAVVVGGPDYDFGSDQRDRKLTHDFVIRNEGQAPLTLSKGATSCKCTVSELANDHVPPGETATVKLEWKLNTPSTRFRQTAEINTNDPASPTILLTVQGKVIDLLRPDPTDLVLNNLTSSEGGRAEFRLYAFTVKDLQVVQHEFTNQESASYFELHFRRLQPDEFPRGQDVTSGLLGQLTVKPGLTVGPVRQTLRVSANIAGAAPLEIPISGTVASDVSVVGPQNFDDEHNLVKLGTVSAADGIQAKLRVLIKGPYRRDVRISVKEIDPADVLAASLDAPIEINNGAVFVYPLTIEVRPDARPVQRSGADGGKFGKIVLETTHPTAKSINLYVRFAVR